MNEIIVKTQIQIPFAELAHHLDKCTFPEKIYGMLGEYPRRTEEFVRERAEEYISEADAKVTIRSLDFSHLDSLDITQAVAYFTAVLAGSMKELVKVVGFGKFFKQK